MTSCTVIANLLEHRAEQETQESLNPTWVMGGNPRNWAVAVWKIWPIGRGNQAKGAGLIGRSLIYDNTCVKV